LRGNTVCDKLKEVAIDGKSVFLIAQVKCRNSTILLIIDIFHRTHYATYTRDQDRKGKKRRLIKINKTRKLEKERFYLFSLLPLEIWERFSSISYLKLTIPYIYDIDVSIDHF